jgi:hypothetical protein
MSLNRLVPAGTCPCPKKKCPRYEKWDECRNNHYKKIVYLIAKEKSINKIKKRMNFSRALIKKLINIAMAENGYGLVDVK